MGMLYVFPGVWIPIVYTVIFNVACAYYKKKYVALLVYRMDFKRFVEALT